MQRLDAGCIAKLGESRDSVLVTLVPRSDSQSIQHANVRRRHAEPVRDVEAELDGDWVTLLEPSLEHVEPDPGHLSGVRGVSVIELLLAELAEQEIEDELLLRSANEGH